LPSRFQVGRQRHARERQQWARDAREIAEHEMVNAWRDPPKGLGRLADSNGNGSGRFGQQFEGDSCTINGEPGTLQRRNGQLLCVPDDSDIDEIFDAAQGGVDPVSAAHRIYTFQLTNAWKRG
jgi:hypothetical protein